MISGFFPSKSEVPAAQWLPLDSGISHKDAPSALLWTPEAELNQGWVVWLFLREGQAMHWGLWRDPILKDSAANFSLMEP